MLKEQESGEVVEDVNGELKPATYYSIALKLKDGFAGNVGVTYNGTTTEETVPYVFMTAASTDPTKLTDTPEDLTKEYEYTGEEITFTLDGFDWYDKLSEDYKSKIKVMGAMSGTEVGDYVVAVGFSDPDYAWGNMFEFTRTVNVTFKIYSNDNKGRFVLIDEMKDSHPFKFQYEDYKVYDKDISEYVYSEADEVFMTRLAFNDTLADLLAQFKNGNEIKVFDAKDAEITNMSQVLATGIVLRLMDGNTVVNQLTISVLGDIDGDGKIGTLDKAQLNAYTLGTRKLEGAKLLAGDIDGDNKIGTLDKAQLNAYTL
ncbi:MAG: dockerin type I repeat-containing protein, partial [Clostridia bacterium]|nr:dockerin type I repeat-containing protein [Clostridia bacterium]